MNIFLAVILGGLFGFALYTVGASNPKKLLSMLRLQDLTLMKIILLGIGFASVLLSLASFMGIFNNAHLDIKPMNLGVITGGLIFGFGFGWAGTCPGTCVAAAGSGGFKKAVAAIIGGLLGAFAFSLSYGWWKKIGLFNILNAGKLTLFNISYKYPSVMPFGYGGLIIAGAIFIAVSVMIPKNKKL